MRVHATLHGFAEKERALELPEGALADDAPRALGIRPELVLVFRADRPLPGDAPLADGDRIRILRVVSGGARRADDWSRPKALLLGLSLVWLLGLVADALWTRAPAMHVLALGGLTLAAAVLGAGGYARPSLRYPATIGAGIVTVAIAGSSVFPLPVLVGVFGVFASTILPVARPVPLAPQA